MTTLESEYKELAIDDEGFLKEGESWDEETAQVLAEHEGIDELSEEKMRILRFLREYYEKHNNWPILANVCRKVGDVSRDCVAREFENPMKAWKIAGLPKPPNVFFTSYDDEHYIANPFY